MDKDIEQEQTPAEFDAEERRIGRELSPLRSLGAPPGSRAINRRALRRGLDSMDRAYPPTHPPWWRRRLSVPVPVAAAFAVLLFLLVYLEFGPSLRHEPAAIDRTESAPSDSARKAEAGSPTRVAAAPGGLQYYESATYIQGVGFLNLESGFRFEEEER